ncbi:hypothetical protein JX580_07825 [Thiomicrospira microaerophila]|uniref:hypothetical protein n=1 Tax=Thiomicrospira microaerophila TaxID=406020 RepID=UPI0020106B92|nr:hypothetical protein [Thiomicrospira microaerophila]UQB41587.1 hypothetical protein JX580_07825 [Thiomicrospira microaerophila]
MLKRTLIKPLSSLVLLCMPLMAGCLDSNKTELNTTDNTAESQIDYGVDYPANGQTIEARMDSLIEAQAFAEAFEFHHRHQSIFHLWHDEALTITPGVEVARAGTCDGALRIEEPEQRQEDSPFITLDFNHYCNPTPLWNTHSAEWGKQVYTGDQSLFWVDFIAYRKRMDGFYTLEVGGPLRVARENGQPTYNYQSLVVKQVSNRSAETQSVLRYQDFKVTFIADRAIYNGKIYHPSYGWVEVSTGANLDTDRVLTASDPRRINRPIEGKIILEGRAGRATLTFNNDQTYNLSLELNAVGASQPAPLTNQAWPD